MTAFVGDGGGKFQVGDGDGALPTMSAVTREVRMVVGERGAPQDGGRESGVRASNQTPPRPADSRRHRRRCPKATGGQARGNEWAESGASRPRRGSRRHNCRRGG
jgi:hypothetical protein